MRKNSRSKAQTPPPQPPQPLPQLQLPLKVPTIHTESSPQIQPRYQQQSSQSTYSHAKLTGSALETQSLRSKPFYRQLFNSPEWDLSTPLILQCGVGDRLYRDWNMHHVFKYVAQCQATVLKLDYNKCPNIIRSLVRTHFGELVNLYLGDNTISSVELLCAVDMPNLVNLHLNDNPITQFRSLRRLNVPKLESLSLRDTKIDPESSVSSFLDLDCPGLALLLLSYREGNILDTDKKIWGKCNWKAKWRNSMSVNPINHTDMVAYICTVSNGKK